MFKRVKLWDLTQSIRDHSPIRVKQDKELFAICDYFEITPQQFFDDSASNPELIQKAVDGMKRLDENDLLMLLGFINRMLKK